MHQVTKLEARAYTLTSANTLYRIELPPGTARFRVQSRVKAEVVKLRFNRGTQTSEPALAPEQGVAAQFWTLAGDPGQYIEFDVTTSKGPRLLYAESAAAGAVVEIVLGI